MWVVAAMLGCADRVEPAPAEVTPLSPVARLIRASMILRGVRPSLGELQDVQVHPERLDDDVGRWLDEPGFGEVVREIEDHAWRLPSLVLQLPANGPLTDVTMSRIQDSLLSAPSRMAERVVMDHLPYTDTVTADWFVADAVVARAWPDVDGFDFDDPDTWQKVQWADGRPTAGLLSDSGLWTRYRSPNANFDRQRANALSRALLCHDFLDAEVVDPGVVVDLTDPDAATEAVSTVPGCVACHQDLDALAGFFPFDPFWAVPSMQFPYAVYDPAYDEAWRDMTGRPPGYFGLGGGDLADLGRYVAADPRFSECAARRFYGWFAQQAPDDVPFEVAAELQGVLVDSGFDAQALARAAVLHPTLAVERSAQPGNDVPGYLTASPRQLARMVEALTGFRWQVTVEEPCCDASGGSSPYGTVDLASDRYVGYGVVGGGFDGDSVLDPKRTPSATGALFQRRLAENAAAYAVDTGAPGLFTRLDPREDASDDAVRDQLADLHLQILGEAVGAHDGPVDETFALWAAADGRGGPAHAWKVTLTAMLRDLRAVTY